MGSKRGRKTGKETKVYKEQKEQNIPFSQK